MQCLKCGKDVTASLTFCDDCLAEMEDFPVDPGTPVHIPKRESPARRVPAQREPTTAEQLTRMRRTLQWMYLLVAILSLLLSITGIMLIRTLDKAPQSLSPVKGQNYTTTQP